MNQPPLILVIDDEADLLEISQMRLQAAGFRVETAIDAQTGYAKARKLQPDLILLDIRMPGINGTEALLDFKADSQLKNLRVAFLTSMTNPWPGVGTDNEKFAKELGAVTFFDKTKDLDNMEELTRRIMVEINKSPVA